MAFIRRKTRPWRWIGAGLVAAGALVAGGLVLRGWIVARQGGIGFSVELTNVASTPARISCVAGEGKAKKEWDVEVPPQQAATVIIRALPADCYDVRANGERALVWSMPKVVSLGGVDVAAEMTTEPADLRPTEALAKRAPTPGEKPAKAAKKPPVSKVFVGEAPVAPAVSAACRDMAALEPLAMLGTLEPSDIACLEGVASGEAPLTEKDEVSRVLLWNAEARRDSVELERLLRRHLDTIDRSDPVICLSLARLCWRKQREVDLEESIRYASLALESKGRFPPSEHVKRVSDLMGLRTKAAFVLYQRADQRYAETKDAKVEGEAEELRGLAKNYAREWYDFATAAKLDPSLPREICRSAAGTEGFCP